MDAWGDESIRAVSDPPVYMLAATYRLDEREIDTSTLKAMLPKGAQKFHWRDMNDRAKVDSLSAIAALGTSHTIVAACSIAAKKQERARRTCLESLLPRLEGMGVQRYVLESRGSHEG